MNRKIVRFLENIKFIFCMLAAVDCILSVKLCLITGQSVYWWLGLICAGAVVFGVCQKPIEES